MSGAVWTEEELGFIEDTLSWPVGRVADSLGRSESATKQKRTLVRKGDAQIWYEPWTPEEDDFLVLTPDLTSLQVAQYLPGRTANSIGRRRRVLTATGRAEDWRRNRDAKGIGNRTVVAMTCLTCGLLLDGTWFYVERRPNVPARQKTTCKRCYVAIQGARPRSKTDNLKPSVVASKKASLSRMQAVTLPLAKKHYEEWAPTDEATLMNPDLTIVEKALVVGRTYSSVQGRCSLLGFRSKSPRAMSDPEDVKWTIDAPNAAALLEAAS